MMEVSYFLQFLLQEFQNEADALLKQLEEEREKVKALEQKLRSFLILNSNFTHTFCSQSCRHTWE